MNGASPRSAFLRRLAGYACGLAAPAVVTLAVLLLPPAGPGSASYAYLYIGGISLVALVFGLGPAVLAAVLSAGLLDYFFVAPVGQLAVASPADVANLAIFVLAALLVGVLAEARRRQERHARELAERLVQSNAELERRRRDAEEGRRTAVELARVSARVDSLAEADRLKTELLANVSHQLRTPLGAIVGMSSALLEPGGMGDAEAARQYAEAINSEGRHLAHLVGDLLEMARLESGRTDLELEPVDALEAARSAADRARNLDPALRLAVEGENVLALADDASLQEVLRNLIENASRYSREVEMACSAAAAAVRLTVADRGPGVPAGEREAIFERFYQGSAAPADGPRQQAGSGLGLAICRRLVEAMSGRIWCDERPGGGSVFTVELARFADAEAGTPTDAPALPQAAP
ncbi:MAG TPA: ATP-binding protein [Candidatus Dormibacteraeota bacterium]|jgi:K+-sensing histidine kinase KdpD|nr:ATP-binding protein [Candidatus Dormibacteraeota bacterium]